MAAPQALHQFSSLTKASDNVQRNLSKSIEKSTLGISKRDMVCVADLCFSRNLFVPNGLKASTTAAGVGPARRTMVRASVLAGPTLEVVRVCVFYTLLQTGVAVPSSKMKGDGALTLLKVDTGLTRLWANFADTSDGSSRPVWLEKLIGKDEEAEKDKDIIKLRRNWHASTKGTLVRKYRVPSKAEGRKILNTVCSLLSDDDSFVDVSTHKGCQIRRENAHAESVCCNNVRALFDELPIPHLVVEITVFPAGPITDIHWQKAEKLEKVIRRGTSI